MPIKASRVFSFFGGSMDVKLKRKAPKAIAAELVSIEETAELFDLHPETIKRRLRCGAWPCYELSDKSLKLDVAEILKITYRPRREAT